MALGDLYRAGTAATDDVYYVDTELYGTAEYGSVYILDTDRPALVDTGIGRHYEEILAAMDDLDIAPADLEVIAPTHVHLDHAGGAGYLAEECPNATVYIHEIGAEHLIDPGRLWEGTKRAVGDQIEFYAEPKPVPAERITELSDGDSIDLGDRELAVHHAPGHAAHQAVYHDPAADGVFTADAAGIYVPSRDEVRPTSPPPGFDQAGCLADVEMIRDLDPAALFYGHFGDAPTGEKLAAYEDVLTAWVDEVAALRERLDEDEAVVEHAAKTADTVDVWGERKARAEAAMNARGVLHYLDESA